MTTSLVTGCAGLIGFWLSKKLLEQGHKVIGIDNLSSGIQENIDELKQNDNFEFFEQDVRKKFEYDGEIDYIYELASRASPVDFEKTPIDILTTNAFGLKNYLDLAVEKNASILYASSSEVYGNPLEHPQKETYWGNVNPNGVRSCYDEAKRFGEALLAAYVREKKVDGKAARIFNTYGPKMRREDGRVIPNFMQQVVKGQPLTIYGDGSQTRSFCYVEDLVEGLQLINEKGKAGECYNTGNPKEYTIIQLVDVLREVFEKDFEISFKKLPQDDPLKRQPDITKIKEEIGWEPKTELKDGLAKTISWFRKIR